MKPVIAMPRLSNEPFRIYMKSKYVFSLWRSGARVVWISQNCTEKDLERLKKCDGFLLPGGVDIEPARYGQETDEKCGKIDLRRDAAEQKMMEAFLPTGKPILGICRGVQFVNVFFGGTLHQHMDGHSDFKARAIGSHNVRILPGTKLAGILGEKTLLVNSMHHQAANAVGKDLMVSACAEDGTIEALEHVSHPFCLAVQWHPEHLSRRRKDQQAIFDAFVAACRP